MQVGGAHLASSQSKMFVIPQETGCAGCSVAAVGPQLSNPTEYIVSVNLEKNRLALRCCSWWRGSLWAAGTSARHSGAPRRRLVFAVVPPAGASAEGFSRLQVTALGFVHHKKPGMFSGWFLHERV